MNHLKLSTILIFAILHFTTFLKIIFNLFFLLYNYTNEVYSIYSRKRL